MFDDVFKDGRVTTRSDWKDIAKYGGAVETHFMDYLTEYPQLGNFLLLDVKGRIAAAALHQILARICKGSTKYTKLFLVNGMVARLTPVEFTMISGLRFVDERTEVERDGPKNLKSRMFPKHHSKKLPLEKLVKKLDEYCDGVYGPLREHPEFVNLVFVWLVTRVLLFDRTSYVPDDIFEVIHLTILILLVLVLIFHSNL